MQAEGKDMTKREKNLKISNYSNDISRIIEAIDKISNTEFVISSNIFSEDFQNIIKRLKDKTFKLAVVGEFSSGKSTFLNALMGKDILKHGAKETTAAITEIKNDVSIKGKAIFDVYYENGEIEYGISADLLTEYTVTSSKTHSVAEEISKVIIKSNIINTKFPISFVDTPGLNGLADNHREKTIEQIKKSHACIYLLQVRGIGQSDIDFLKFISKYQHNIIFVQNFIDELKELEGETPEEKVEEQRRIIEEKIFNEECNVKYEIIPISARKALIAKDNDITQFENIELTCEEREKLYEESGFEVVIDKISDLITSNERGHLQQKDSISVALELLEQLYEIVSFQNDQEKEEWKNSPEERKKRNYEKIITELNKNKKVYADNISNFIEADAADIRKSTGKRIDNNLIKLETSIKTILGSISSIDEFDTYM